MNVLWRDLLLQLCVCQGRCRIANPELISLPPGSICCSSIHSGGTGRLCNMWVRKRDDTGGVRGGFWEEAWHRSPCPHPGLPLLPMNNVAQPLPSGRPGIQPYQAVVESKASRLASLASATFWPHKPHKRIPNLQRGALGSKMAIKAWFANTFPMIKM